MSYIRSRRPPLLAVWGKNDPFFLPAGAEAFKPRRFARHLFRQIQENRTIILGRLRPRLDSARRQACKVRHAHGYR